MSNVHEHNQTIVYQIRLKGYLHADWSEWLGGLTVALEDDHTLLTGRLDQAALHGLLKKVRDLGLTLVSVNPVDKTGVRDEP